jgi:uncharacterized protein with FMN-binding domain
VRSATKTFVGLAGIGVVLASAKLGMPVAVAAAPVANATAAPTPTATPTPAETPNTTPTKKPATTPSAPSTKPTTSVASTTKSGSAISYKYGVVQVKVTKKSGKISSISYLKKSATDGRSAVFPDLVVAAKAANGSGISNISGATFTVDAFKKALDSALAKF